MKIYIRRQGGEKDESEMGLYLNQSSPGIVQLIGVDRKGDHYSILEISDMGLRRGAAIPADTGWPVDGDGRIRGVT